MSTTVHGGRERQWAKVTKVVPWSARYEVRPEDHKDVDRWRLPRVMLTYRVSYQIGTQTYSVEVTPRPDRGTEQQIAQAVRHDYELRRYADDPLERLVMPMEVEL